MYKATDNRADGGAAANGCDQLQPWKPPPFSVKFCGCGGQFSLLSGEFGSFSNRAIDAGNLFLEIE